MGRLDVDAMLSEITPEQFAEWAMADNLGILSDTWGPAATVAATITNEISRIMAGFGGGKQTVAYPWQYFPTGTLMAEPPESDDPTSGEDSIARFANLMRAKYGGK